MSGASPEEPESASEYVRLNVGGTIYFTTKGVLTKEDNMLQAMFSGRMPLLRDEDGFILVDRDGRHFRTILSYLRDGDVALPNDRQSLLELQAEAKYYLVENLSQACEYAILNQRAPTEYQPECLIPYIKSSRDELMIINHSKKPVVKFLCNRHNNKYSYTMNSDDNLLRNIELFDKLSLRFNERIMFIKDTLGGSEIVCWSFFGCGQKVAEVSCTSIVYGTDKKHTKVEFPEARIYEETLNLTLFENDNHRQGVRTTLPSTAHSDSILTAMDALALAASGHSAAAAAPASRSNSRVKMRQRHNLQQQQQS